MQHTLVRTLNSYNGNEMDKRNFCSAGGRIHLSFFQDKLLPLRQLGVVLRRDEPGEEYFGKKHEGVGRMRRVDDRTIGELKRLDGKRRMTGAVVAGIAPVYVLVLIKGGAGNIVRQLGNNRCRLSGCHLIIGSQGMGTYVRTSHRHAQYEQDDQPGNCF